MWGGYEGVSQNKLKFGFDFLGSRVYAYRGGTMVDDQLLTPSSKEEITEEFERALAMYVGCGGDGSRHIQYEENGELLTFEVQVRRVETTRRLREKKTERFKGLHTQQTGSFSSSLTFFLLGIFIVSFFVMRVLN